MTDRNCLSYWFPILAKSGVPVPKTEIVKTDMWLAAWLYDGPLPPALDPSGQQNALDALTEAQRPTKVKLLKLADEVRGAALRISETGPWFLRSGHFSGKHYWSHTCDLRDLDKVGPHMMKIVEMSEMFGMFGELPTDVWCVRSRLKVRQVACLPKYGNMPVVREYRAFVRGGRIVCAHPYWPLAAIQDGIVSQDERTAHAIHHDLYGTAMPHRCYDLILKVAEAFNGNGDWSVDLLEAEDDWYVTDMAEAHRSWHDDTCWLKDKFKKPETKQ